MDESEDRIVYLVVTEAGGVDGLDPKDKGNEVVLATYSKTDAIQRKGNDSRYRIVSQVITPALEREKAISRLTPLQRLVLEIK